MRRLLCLMVVLVLGACSDFYPKLPPTPPTDTIEFVVLPGSEGGSIEAVHSPMSFMAADGVFITSDEMTTSFNIRSRYEAPVIDGIQTFANHSTIAGRYAYVTFASQGDDLYGGFDVIDLKTDEVVQSVHYKEAKVRIAVVTGNYLLVGVTRYNDTACPVNCAAMEKILLADGLVSEAQTSIYRAVVPGWTVVDITVGDDSYYVGTGTHGGVYRINKGDFSILAERPIEDVRSISYNYKGVAVTSGPVGRLSLWEEWGLTHVSDWGIGGLNIPEARATGISVTNWHFASTGLGGLTVSRLFHVSDEAPNGAFLNIPTVTDDENDQLNGISFGQCWEFKHKECSARLLFMASGGSGLRVAVSDHEVTEWHDIPFIRVVGTLEADVLSGSTNFVASDNKNLVVANGFYVYLIDLF